MQPTESAVVCCQVSRLSNTQRKHLSRVLNRAENTWQQRDTYLSHYCFCTCSLLDKSFQSVCIRHTFYKILPDSSDFCPLDFTVKKSGKTNDRDVYGGTEIEVSNYPAVLTHIGLSSCGQTVQHPLCCHWRAQWDRSGFVNCICQNLWKIAAH